MTFLDSFTHTTVPQGYFSSWYIYYSGYVSENSEGGDRQQGIALHIGLYWDNQRLSYNSWGIRELKTWC